MRYRFGLAVKQTATTFMRMLPVLVGVAALSTLLAAAIPAQSIAALLPPESLLSALFGVAVGSIASGHPLTSYVLAGELLAGGISLVAVTGLIISWVTVGIVQLPAEAAALGLRFAVWRTTTCVVFAIVIAYVVPFLASVEP
jgi:hypothetical protein